MRHGLQRSSTWTRSARSLDTAEIDSTDPNLSAFVARGGKLLLWHDWTDGLIPAQNTIDYYEKVLATIGAERVKASVRLFMAPGVDHCSGGEGPFQIDELEALDAWVESGKAPEQLVASRPLAGGARRTRPLCPYPQVARYRGQGSTDEASKLRLRAAAAALRIRTAGRVMRCATSISGVHPASLRSGVTVIGKPETHTECDQAGKSANRFFLDGHTRPFVDEIRIYEKRVLVIQDVEPFNVKLPPSICASRAVSDAKVEAGNHRHPRRVQLLHTTGCHVGREACRSRLHGHDPRSDFPGLDPHARRRRSRKSRRGAGRAGQHPAAGHAPVAPLVADGQLAGAAALVWRDGTVVERVTVGRRDCVSGAPVEPDTLFRIASLTKPVTTAAALSMLDEGRFALDDPIVACAPELAGLRVLRDPDGPLDQCDNAARAITFGDLLTHRSGLTYGDFHRGPVGRAYADALGSQIDNPLTPDQWIARLATLPLIDQPGAGFHYGHSTDNRIPAGTTRRRAPEHSAAATGARAARHARHGTYGAGREA